MTNIRENKKVTHRSKNSSLVSISDISAVDYFYFEQIKALIDIQK